MRWLSVFFLALLIPSSCLAQSKPAQVPDFWDTRAGLRYSASAQMFASGGGLQAVCLRVFLSDQSLLWPQWQLEIDSVPPLRTAWLHELEDGTPPNLKDPVPFHERPAKERAYILLFSQALTFASRTPHEVFERDARENAGVSIANLYVQPGRYRGKPIVVQGRLQRVRRWDAPSLAQQQGIQHVYEGWINGPTRGAAPIGIVFSEAPDWLQVKENLNIPVTFFGYFLQNVRHKVGNSDRDSPLVIGRSIVREEEVAAPPAPPFSREILFWSLVGIVLLVGLGLLMGWWFRAGDRQVQNRLKRWQDMRGQESIDNVEQGSATSPPMALPVQNPNHRGVTEPAPR